MRSLLVAIAALLSGACTAPEARLAGSLGEGWPDDPLHARVDGVAEPAELRNGGFLLDAVPAGPVRLRILSGEDEIAALEIEDLPAGAELTLERLRRDRARDAAFPARVRLDGADVVVIDGVRLADAESLPRRVDEEGVVLAVNGSGDRLLLRPDDERLPDLPVVGADETEVEDASGDEVSPRSLQAGDRLRVEGATEAGYVHAHRIVLREPADDEPTRDEEARDDDAGDEREAERPRRGRDGREDGSIPPGHRPPPGECRDWNPNLPPGQQPPPRKC